MFRRREASRVEAALCGVERPISNVPEIDLPKLRISLAHPLQDSDCRCPERNAQYHTPPGCQRKGKADGDQQSDEHELAVTPEKLVGTIGAFVNHHFSERLRILHALNHCCVDAERRRQQRSGEYQDRNDQANHARASAELTQLPAPQHGASGNCNSN